MSTSQYPTVRVENQLQAQVAQDVQRAATSLRMTYNELSQRALANVGRMDEGFMPSEIAGNTIHRLAVDQAKYDSVVHTAVMVGLSQEQLRVLTTDPTGFALIRINGEA